MAYKTPELRHIKEQMHDGSFSLENRLQQYLRDNYSIDALTAPEANAACEKVLEKVAFDYDMSSGKQEDLGKDYSKLAKDTITKFISNQQDKPTTGKGPALGLSQDPNERVSLLTNIISGLRY